jgi:hypothetical protein
MTDDRLSKKQDRALHRVFESVLLTRFPNPERKDCPSRETLLAIAHQKLPMRDPSGNHVTRCSPCFGEFMELRDHLRRTRVLWSLTTATAVTVALLLGYVVFRAPIGGAPVPTAVQVTPQLALLDLRDFSLPRSPSSSSGPNPNILRLNRAFLELTIQLPIGAEEGPYELQIQKEDQRPLAAAKGGAKIENHVTTLHVQIDASRIAPGNYLLAVKHADFNWRYYPLALQ